MEDVTITAFTIQDIPRIIHMQPEGWDDIRKEFLLYTIQTFCRPIKVLQHNRIIGLGALILHQDSAWLGHIIVDSSCRGRGVGTQIVEHLIALAHSYDIYTIHLIATNLGAPVYRKVGFRDAGLYATFRKTIESKPTSIDLHIGSIKPSHRQQILQLDRETTGENREALLDLHLQHGLVFESKEEIEGYYLPYLGQGPIYAYTVRAGLALMELKYSSADIAILPQDNRTGTTFLSNNGFEIQEFTAIRMVLGKETSWLPQHVYSRIGGNYG
jgi:GNAT superfamily N-acetyltransferase